MGGKGHVGVLPTRGVETTPPGRAGATRLRGVHSAWERLLQVTAVAEGVALLGVAAILGDVEAAVVAAGFAVGMALLHLRSGLLGRILLALAATNVLVWMSMATFSILAGGDGATALLIPALLTVLSLTTLVAALGASAGRRWTAASTPAPLVVAGGAAGLFAVLLILGAVAPGGSQRAAQAGDLAVSTANLRFTETELIAEGAQVGVVVENEDLFWHTFTIDELSVDLPVPVNGERRVTFDATPGTYTYYCRVPGHETLMRGTLTVR